VDQELTLLSEYALNAVNEGVTSLGIKGSLSMITSKAITGILTSKSSYKRCCPGHGKEILITAYRPRFPLQSIFDHPKHWYGIFRNGSRLPYSSR
jgi:hypothetical protein